MIRIFSSRFRVTVLVFGIIVGLTLAFVGGNHLFSQLTNSTGVESEDNGKSITLLTYNIFDYSLDQVFPVLQESGADIMVLQEVDARFVNGTPVSAPRWFSSQLGYFHFQDQYYSAEYHGNTILSRWPIINEYQIDLPRVRGINRSLLVAQVITPYGNLTVLGSHLQQLYHPRDQAMMVDRIFEEVQNFDRLVFLCDCNTPDDLVFGSYRDLSLTFEDGWIAAGQESFNGNTWPSSNPVLRVDYIWGFHVPFVLGSAKLLGNNSNSDHKALLLAVQLK